MSREIQLSEPLRLKWEAALAELEDFYKDAPLPDPGYRLSPSEILEDPEKFVKTHLAFIHHNFGARWLGAYVIRLRELKAQIELTQKAAA